MGKQYTVVHDFKDLEDKKQRIYRKGDVYEGEPTEERLAALTTKNNAIKEVLIAEVSEEKEADEKEAAEPVEKPKAKGKKAKAE